LATANGHGRRAAQADSTRDCATGSVVQERGELLPGVVPEPDYRCVLGAPLLGELVECSSRGVGVHSGVDGFHVVLDRVPVAPGGEPERVADQVDDARLDRAQRPHVADHLREPLQAVADDEEGVLDAAVAQVGEDAHPELCALPAGAGPQPEDVLLPAQGDADGCVDGPVRDLSVADLHHAIDGSRR
jgi:hypothetical protein